MQSTNSTQSFWRLLAIAILAVLLMALVPVVIKHIQLDPWLIGFSRLIISVFGLIILALFFSGSLISQSQNWPAIALIGLIFACHWLTYFYSIQYSTASIAAIGVSTYGAHLLLLGWFFQGHRPGFVECLCIIVAFIGVYLVIPEFNLSDQVSLGLGLGVISGFLYALLPMLHQKYKHINNQRRTFGQFFVAMLVFAAGLPQAEMTIPQNTIVWLLILGVVCTLIAHSLWVKVTTELSHLTTSVVYYLYVPCAMLLSYFFLAEQLTFNKLLGAGLIVFANIIGIFYRSKISRN